MKPRILFMGTPEIAVTCLDAVIAGGYPVSAVVTRVDKPQGRHAVLTPPPVKVYAEAHGIPVCQPRTLRDEAFADYLKEVNPDLILVVAFGMILPRTVLGYPRFGCINVHASLLPKYRGAAPMQRAIMDGERETGVTIMYMDEGLDTGDMISSEATPIGDADTLGTVHDRLSEIGARKLVDAVNATVAGTITRTPQPQGDECYAKKIEREDCRLRFTESTRALDCRIRALTPMPLAFFTAPEGKTVKVLAARPAKGAGKPGEILAVSISGDGELLVATGDGALAVTGVLPEGKSRMTAADYLRGRRLTPGEVLL